MAQRHCSSGHQKEEVARLTGLEPATPGVTGRYSNQLSYNRHLVSGLPRRGRVLRGFAGGVKRGMAIFDGHFGGRARGERTALGDGRAGWGRTAAVSDESGAPAGQGLLCGTEGTDPKCRRQAIPLIVSASLARSAA